MSVTKLDKNSCTGCGGCKFVCPFNAIDFIENSEGFYEPFVNDKCVECGLCEKKCPQLDDVKLVDPLEVYQSINISDDYNNSASGGTVYKICEDFINNKGIVYGTRYFDDLALVKHFRITTISELKQSQGSFYVQSIFDEIISSIKKDLVNKEKVLVIGSPCQIASLKKLFNSYDNLITIDFVCHGVPSPKFFNININYLKNKFKFNNLRFRIKKWNSINRYAFEFNSTNKKIVGYEKDVFYNAFVKNYSQREVCYNCKYASSKRCSDITVGDAVVDVCNKEFYPYHLKTLTCLNTKKGIYLFNSVNLKKREINYSKEVSGNKCLRCSENRGKVRDYIYKDLNTLEYRDFISKYLDKLSFSKKMFKYFELLLPYKLKRKLKMVVKK